jgi:hypothetical protein
MWFCSFKNIFLLVLEFELKASHCEAGALQLELHLHHFPSLVIFEIVSFLVQAVLDHNPPVLCFVP